ncbi:hypothetical protein KQI65_06960 [bacterium]|nr:hypothetical protein [bacterium]
MGLVLISSGCASLDDVMRAKADGSEGTTATYPVTEDQAWEIAKTVFRWEGADAVEEHREDGFMLTSSGMTLFTSGTVMGAWLEPAGDQKTTVTVITKRRIATNFVTTLTESTFHKRFAQAVRIIESGQKLPLIAPEWQDGM